jgi:hypothetical protein
MIAPVAVRCAGPCGRFAVDLDTAVAFLFAEFLDKLAKAAVGLSQLSIEDSAR